MDTHGHESCAADAGLAQITEALSRVAKMNWRLQAFYFGNWLTDVSQAVDPVAYDAASGKISRTMDGVVNGVKGYDVPYGFGAIKDALVRELESIRDKGRAALDLLKGGRSSDAATACRKAFFVIGYFKFVHPRQGGASGARARMNYDAYKHVFDARYTQYYPHEHLDRWPPSLTERGGFAANRVSGTVTPDGRGTGNTSISPHLYNYLREDLQIAAGLLAQVDHEWARLTFNAGGPWTSDDDPVWNEWLAKLGHALHALEDYFAHSNFIELAIDSLPDKASFEPPPAGHLSLPDSEEAVFKKRLKRFSDTTADNDVSRWQSLAAEDHVVTGYFDFIDTIHSLSHVAGDLWDKHHHGGGGTDWNQKVGKLMRNTIEQVQTQLRGQASVTPAQASAAAHQVVTDQFAHGDPDARQAADELLNYAPADVRDACFAAIGLFCKRVPGVALSIYDAFEALDEFMEFIEAPLRAIDRALHYVPDAIAEWARNHFVRPIEERIKRLLDTYLLGRFRVGCHSLMAKDYAWGRSNIDRIYEQAKNCAKGVHWYVVKTMTRWSVTPSAAVGRAPSGGGATTVTTLDHRRAVDWLEMVEFFLRHPTGTTAPRWWDPVIRGTYQSLPGYNGTSPERAGLPHQLVFLTAAQAQSARDAGDSLRSGAEARYVP